MNFSKLKVLVVNNWAPIRKSIAVILQQAGFKQFIEAENSKEALIELRNNKINLIISCYGISGLLDVGSLDLLKEVRGDENLKDIPFIMVIGKRSKELTKKIEDAGADGIIDRLSDPFVFQEKVKKVLEEKEKGSEKDRF